MFRAALATAGAHETAPHKTIQAVLHPTYTKVVVPC